MIKAFVDFLNDFGLTKFVLPILIVAVVFFFFRVSADTLSQLSSVWRVVILAAPAWVPMFFLLAFWRLWMRYIWILKQLETDHTLLEIRLPVEISQSPRAMELVVDSLYQTGEIDTPIDSYWKGNQKPWFSLEIASLEGRVHFFIWTRTRYKDLVEAQLYAHYPTVEVVEASDYVKDVQYDESVMDIWGVEQKLQNPDPYPIKTYVDFGLDKEQKEEFKHDPLVSLLEFLGSLGKGEFVWMQMGIRAHTQLYKKPGTWFGKMRWDGLIKQEIAKILERTRDKETGKTSLLALTAGEKDAIEALERSLQKKPFDTGIRMLYMWRKDSPKAGERKAGLPTVMRSFEYAAEGMGYNGLKPIFVVGPFYYPWQDFMGMKRHALKHRLYNAYRWRSFFFPPYKRTPFVLGSEEVATIFHFPGRVATTPTLERIQSKRAEAPANLPV
jgi:hypothetical protein